MKRALSLFIAVMMVVSAFAACIPAASAATLDENNVSINVPYFSGTAYFNDVTGKMGKQEYYFDEPLPISGEENPDVVKSEDSALTLDGVIDLEEWGTPILDLSTDYAAVTGDTSVSGENTYYWHGTDGSNYLDVSKGLHYKLWMAWDEEYLYVAANIDDPDGQLLDAGGVDVWNGDCLQIRVDPDGPNSAVGGTGYDAYTNPWPWASTERGGWGETYGGKVMNLGIGYMSSGDLEIFDMSPRYTPVIGDALDSETAEPIKVLNWTQNASFYRGNYEDSSDYNPELATVVRNPFGNTYGAAWLTSASSAANWRAINTQIEVAIPWAYMNGSKVEVETSENEAGEIQIDSTNVVLTGTHPEKGQNAEYGLAIALLNGGRGGLGYNSWLTWGSGICAGQFEKDAATAGGSNSMILVDDELGTIGCEHDFAAATCEACETCTLCGYERGYATGHTYTHELVKAPTSTEDGLVISTCVAGCNGVVETAIPAGKSDPTYVWDPNGTVASSIWSDGFNYLYYQDEDMKIPVIDPETNMQKDAIEYDENGEMYFDFTTTDTGTYYATNKNFKEFAYSIDFALTGEDITEYDEKEDGTLDYSKPSNANYADGFYYNFGGTTYFPSGKSYGINYIAGFFPDAAGSTSGKFAIYTNCSSGLIAEPKEGECILLAETDKFDLGTDWHTMVLSFDEDTDTAILYLDGEAILGVWDPALDMAGNDQILIMRNFEVAAKVKNMQIGAPDAFNAIGEPVGPTLYTVTVDGVELGKYEAGETVNLDALAAKTISGFFARFFTYNSADVEVTRSAYNKANTVNGRAYSFVMPEGDVALTTEYVILGNLYNSDSKVNSRDTAILKKFVNNPATVLTEQQKEAADIELDGKVNSRDTLSMKKLANGTYTPKK